MIGDKIIITAEHKKKAKKVFNEFLTTRYKKGAQYIIQIGGEAGTGKTEIALILRELFYDSGIRSDVIHVDDYYKTKWSERNEIRKRTGIIGKKEIDWDKINGVINTFRADFYTCLVIQRINKFTESIEKAIIDKRNIDVLIIEGLYALYARDNDFKVFIEGTYKDTEGFRLLRNKEPQTKFRQKVLQKEHSEVIKSKPFANMII